MAINKWFFCIYNKVFNEIAVQRYEIIRNSDRLPALFFLAAYTMCPHFRVFSDRNRGHLAVPLDGQRAPGRHILSHGGDRYFNAGGKFKFLRSLKHHYTYYTREWYSPRGRAWTELKNILLDNDQVKAVAATDCAN